jgi:rhamnosyltransferase
MIDKVTALVVSYFPDDAVILKLMQSLASQVDHLILIDNGGGESAAAAAKSMGIGLEHINLGKNLGLGHALNVGFERAAALGAKYVATFDQDSAPLPDLIDSLKKVHQDLEAKGVNCAAVAPVFFDRRESAKVYFPFYYEEEGRILSATPATSSENVVETDVLITSGMLVRTDVWTNGVHYDEGLFVDYTDTEWCFRARSQGYRLFGCLRVEMGHAPSDAPPARVFGFSFFRYSPLRRYYYFRNTVKFCLAPYVSWTWKRRLSMGLALRFGVNLVIDEKKWRSFKMMLLGALDGFRGRTGEFLK